MNKIIENFIAPSTDYRGAPFWAWNATLNPEELKRQIRTFHDMGFGGFFMHARTGLNTPYLGPEWFTCVKTCIAEAKSLNMKAYLYDEDRYPSGAAGSLVTREDRFKLRFCKYEILDSCQESTLGGKTLAWFSIRVKEKDGKLKVVSARRLTAPTLFKATPNTRLLRFAEVLARKHPWYNGETYLDTLNKDAVRAFINATHEAYRREVGEDFGKTVPAIFTDEPNFCHGQTEFFMPWTQALPERFKQKYGHDLLDLLPEIFFASIRRCSAARLQFMDTITQLFVEAFPRQIGEWCDKHHLMLTGHALMEDSLFQAFFVGSVMRFYEYMQMPGIDLLTEHWAVFNTAKQCSSMAHQFGRRQRLTETYGCTGWDFPFMGHKALGEWQYALGINFRCQHLAWYSAAGEGKRDYPASISYQSPWHAQYPKVENYFARLGAALSQGTEIIDLLVIHPIESAWLKLDVDICQLPMPQREKAMGNINRRFAQLTNRLLEQKLDFDFGEEEVISRHGSVADGRFRIAKAAYRAVLLPPMATIRSSTLNLLEQFAQQGGTVIYLGTPPAHLDGFNSPMPAQKYARFQTAPLQQALVRLAPLVRRVSVTRDNGRQIGPILTRLTQCDGAYCAFLVNYGQRFTANIQHSPMVRDRKLIFPQAHIELNIPRAGQVYELNPNDGHIHPVDAHYEGNHYTFETAFQRLQSHLFLVTADDVPASPQPPTSCNSKSRPHRCPIATWSYSLSEPNLLLLDHASWSLNATAHSQEEYILDIDQQVRAFLGVPARGGHMQQPWFLKEQTQRNSVSLELKYHFKIETLPENDCELAVEFPESYVLELNGRTLSSLPQGWWCDRDIQTIAVPRTCLQTGTNSLVLRCNYHADMAGLEALYLLGDFGVRNHTLTSLPQSLQCGDWTQQGFPYYAGNLTYHGQMTLPPSGGLLQFKEWRGTALGISINGKPETLLAWPPFEIKLPGGKTNLDITVYGSRRNAMGPFFCRTAWPIRTGPNLFRIQEQKKRQLVPSGLLEAPILRY